MDSRQNISNEFEYKYDSEIGGAVITKYIGNSASVCIPDSLGGEEVMEIIGRAFSGCSYLISITIDCNMLDIDEYAFYNCSNLTSVSFMGGGVDIYQDAFSSCSNLTSINIDGGGAEINRNAFSGCASLTHATYNGRTYSALNDFFNALDDDEF